MIAAGNDGRASRDSKYIHRNIAAQIAAITKLTKAIVTPALHTTFWCNHAGMCNTSRDSMGLNARDRDETKERD